MIINDRFRFEIDRRFRPFNSPSNERGDGQCLRDGSCSHSSWTLCRGTNSTNACFGIEAITGHGNSSVTISFCAWPQLTGRESLRDIETCLRAMQPKLYHAGIQGNVSKSTLADANEKRDWRIYAEFAQVLIRQARTPKTTSEYNSKRLRRSSIPAPSICVFPFSRGLDSVGAKPPSSSTR